MLADYLGGTDVAGGKLKEAKTAHWSSPNSGASNSTGFRALPGGSRANNGDFVNLRYSGNWWSASENGANVAWYRGMYQSTGGISRYFGSKDYGFSVRCVKD